jgi:tail accessory factor
MFKVFLLMATNAELIQSALRLIGVLDEIQAVSAEQGENGLVTMNDLFMEWDADGIDIGFFPQTDLTAESPIYVDAQMVAKYNLAIVLSQEYGTDPKPAVVAVAVRGYDRLVRDAAIAKQEEADMSHLQGVWPTFDIENG